MVVFIEQITWSMLYCIIMQFFIILKLHTNNNDYIVLDYMESPLWN